MNFDICNKCNKSWIIKKNKNDYSFYCMNVRFLQQGSMLLSGYEKGRINSINISQKQFDNIINNGKDLFEENYMLNKQMISEELKKIIMKIKVNRNCPYYMEHLINDWNQKNE